MDRPILAFNSDSWNGMPYPRAMAWTRIFFDFPPVWPGASLMSFAYQGFCAGNPAGIAEWVERARQAERLGFTPADYELYLLCLSAHDKPVAVRPTAMPVFLFDPTEAAAWLAEIRGGANAMSAHSAVRSGNGHGRGFGVRLDSADGLDG